MRGDIQCGRCKVRRETSLRDSFHFLLFCHSTCNSPTEARSTCNDIVDGASSRLRLSVPATTPNSPDFDGDTVPPEVVAAPPRRPSRPGVVATALNSPHHLHLVTTVVLSPPSP